MKTTIIIIGLLVANIAGNFIYQILKKKPDYSVAMERSWFEGVIAIQIICMLYYLR